VFTLVLGWVYTGFGPVFIQILIFSTKKILILFAFLDLLPFGTKLTNLNTKLQIQNTKAQTNNQIQSNFTNPNNQIQNQKITNPNKLITTQAHTLNFKTKQIQGLVW
jgi:hypothetical protein